MKNKKTIKLNLGCGHIIPDGWINVDNSFRANLKKSFCLLDDLLVNLKVIEPTDFNSNILCMNLSKKLKFEDNSIDFIYMGEFLEHLIKKEAEHLIGECFRILKNDGVLRIRVPDVYLFWKKYVDDYENNYSKGNNNWDSNRSEKYFQMHYDNICTKRILLKSMGHFHKWSYDEISLTMLLNKNGFTNIQRKEFLDSAIPDVHEVEKQNNLIIECRKPFSKSSRKTENRLLNFEFNIFSGFNSQTPNAKQAGKQQNKSRRFRHNRLRRTRQ